MTKFKDQFKKLLVGDKKYIERRFRRTYGRDFNIENPKTFNEKINYLKLNGFKKSYVTFADKYTVRSYIKDTIGETYLVDLLGVYDDVDDIDIHELPQRFVLKVTHGSGYNIVVKHKENLKISSAKKQLKKWMKEDYYLKGREPVYKGIVPKVICEEFLEEADGTEIKDYKLFCFNGKVEYIQIDNDRSTLHTRDFYNRVWERQDFGLQYPQSSCGKLTKPLALEEMIGLAEKLSSQFPFIRVDFYNVNGRIYFGELTFYPENGFGKFHPESIDFMFGKKLSL